MADTKCGDPSEPPQKTDRPVQSDRGPYSSTPRRSFRPTTKQSVKQKQQHRLRFKQPPSPSKFPNSRHPVPQKTINSRQLRKYNSTPTHLPPSRPLSREALRPDTIGLQLEELNSLTNNTLAQLATLLRRAGSRVAFRPVARPGCQALVNRAIARGVNSPRPRW